MSILGNRVLRTEDDRFLRGRGTYVENLALEGAASITLYKKCEPTLNIVIRRWVGTACKQRFIIAIVIIKSLKSSKAVRGS